MKLISCHIENFGKIHDFDMDFTDGVNITCQENGWGKSTFAAFVRTMFYGLEGKRKTKKIEENDYQRYTPWQGGVFGGRLTFEVNGKQYTITRTFGAKEEFELRDASTNLISTDYTENIGLELFQVNRESFMRTVFIGQNDCKTESTDDIHSKIGNLTDNTNDMNSYEKAEEILKKIENALTPSKKTGSIKKREGEIVELRREVALGESIVGSIATYQGQIAAGKEQCEQLKKEKGRIVEEQTRVVKLQRTLAKKDEWENLKKVYATRKEALDAARAKFPGEVPLGSEIERYIDECITLDTVKERMQMFELAETEKTEISALESAFQGGVPDKTKIDEMQEVVRQIGKRKSELEKKQNELSTQKAIASAISQSKSSISPLVYVGGIGLIAGVALCFVSMIAGIILLLVGVVLLGIGLVAGKKVKEPEIPAEIVALETEVQQKQSEVEEHVHRVSSYLKQYEHVLGSYVQEERFAEQLYALQTKAQTYESLCKKRSNWEKAKGQYELSLRVVTAFLESVQVKAETDMRRQLDAMKLDVREYLTAQQLYQEASEHLKNFEEGIEVETLQADISPENLPNLDFLNSEVERLTEEIDELQDKIRGNQQILDELKERFDEWEENKEKLDELIALQEKEQERYRRIVATKEYLAKAKESITARYVGPILEKFKEYYEKITGDDGVRFYMDANTKVTVEEYGKQRDTDMLSAGYQDLIGICLRIAFVDAMYQEEIPMLIMDDPFVNLDDKKVKAARELLAYVAEKYQVIYFTCSKARS